MERVTELSGEGGAHPGYCASPELHHRQGAVCLHSPVCPPAFSVWVCCTILISAKPVSDTVELLYLHLGWLGSSGPGWLGWDREV